MTDIFVAPKNPPAGGGSHMNALSAFCQNPKGVSFQNQKDEESIVLFLRSHFATNLSWIFLSFVLVVLPIIVGIFLPRMHIGFLSSQIAMKFTSVYVLFYYLIVFSYTFISFLVWFYNVFIVTTERIVDINYSDIVVHNMAESSLDHIEDVRYTQSGFIPSFLNYGDLFIQTAGTEEHFQATSIPKPEEATNIITQLMEKK